MTLMVERSLPPEMSTYRAAINGSCDAGMLDAAVGFLDQVAICPALRLISARSAPDLPLISP